MLYDQLLWETTDSNVTVERLFEHAYSRLKTESDENKVSLKRVLHDQSLDSNIMVCSFP